MILIIIKRLETQHPTTNNSVILKLAFSPQLNNNRFKIIQVMMNRVHLRLKIIILQFKLLNQGSKWRLMNLPNQQCLPNLKLCQQASQSKFLTLLQPLNLLKSKNIILPLLMRKRHLLLLMSFIWKSPLSNPKRSKSTWTSSRRSNKRYSSSTSPREWLLRSLTI